MKPFDGKITFGELNFQIYLIHLSINYIVNNPNYSLDYPSLISIWLQTDDKAAKKILKEMNSSTSRGIEKIEVSFAWMNDKSETIKMLGSFDSFVHGEYRNKQAYLLRFRIDELFERTQIKEIETI